MRDLRLLLPRHAGNIEREAKMVQEANTKKMNLKGGQTMTKTK